MQTQTLLELPDEILLKIICRLNVKDILHCELICRQLKLLLADDFTWKKIYKHNYSSFFHQLTNQNEKQDSHWRELYLDKSCSHIPSLHLLLTYLNLFKTRYFASSKSFLSSYLSLLTNYPNAVREEILIQTQDEIIKTYQSSDPAWRKLILALRGHAETIDSLIVSRSPRSTLANVLHALANLIIQSLQTNYLWQKSLETTRQQIHNTKDLQLKKEKIYGLALIGGDPREEMVKAFNDEIRGVNQRSAYNKIEPLKIDPRILDSQHAKKVYESALRPLGGPAFREFIQENSHLPMPAKLRM